MTQETPPGWYADPGQTSDGPATERWWDGKAWTDRIRPAQPPAWGPPTGPAPTGPAPSGQAPGGTPPAPAESEVPGTGQPAGAAAPTSGETPGAGGQAGTDAPGAGEPGDAGQAAVPGQYPSGAGQAASGWGPGGNGYPGAASQPAVGGQPGGSHPAGGGYPAAHPAYPAYPAAPPGGQGRRLRIGAAVAAAVVVLTCIGVGVYALADDGGKGDAPTSQAPGGPGAPGGQGGPFGGPGGSGGSGGSGGDGGSGGSGGQSPRPEQSQPPKIRSGSVTDTVSGISLPIPKGWYGQQANAGAQVTSDDSYKCPGDTSSTCTKGGAYSAPALLLGAKGATAEEIAKADIAKNAEESYGGKSYGGITSHDVLDSKAVTVAGQRGYLVRWKAVTKKGADGIVESLAFPSPANAKQMVVVRFGVDADQKEAVLDEITKGIKVSMGSGNGQDV
ncbi:DUF2510 domain-containing protein [Streptomyces sp. NPDC101110]|uniref:DUF2510 domain-containing protein n=1 Tax=Streptomyces sp. NPDC101110 TaxID=3366104 RepID=UPI003805163A